MQYWLQQQLLLTGNHHIAAILSQVLCQGIHISEVDWTAAKERRQVTRAAGSRKTQSSSSHTNHAMASFLRAPRLAAESTCTAKTTWTENPLFRGESTCTGETTCLLIICQGFCRYTAMYDETSATIEASPHTAAALHNGTTARLHKRTAANWQSTQQTPATSSLISRCHTMSKQPASRHGHV